MSDWDEACAAFAEAADWFGATCAAAGERWDRPGLGDWDLRALVGHTSRALLTVEEYAARPADDVAADSPVAYFHAARAIAQGSGVAERGRAAGRALGADPAAEVAAIAARVVPLPASLGPDHLLTTVVGGMRLADYLPTRTFELAVHTADIAAAVGAPLDVPPRAARAALAIVSRLAVENGQAGALLLTATGRAGTPPVSVL
ncbi:MAG TPA: maleylpyruvate isomerase N-terminal domain-containing protein [Nocardioides sp.]|nr:maleylpyruvate isomerase N-terminal domain-containing protein [Nocardioides sp.]